MCVCVCARASVCVCVFVSVNMYVCIWFMSSLHVYACMYSYVYVYMCTQHIHVFGPFHNDLVRVSDQGVHILDSHWFYIKHAGSLLDT